MIPKYEIENIRYRLKILKTNLTHHLIQDLIMKKQYKHNPSDSSKEIIDMNNNIIRNEKMEIKRTEFMLRIQSFCQHAHNAKLCMKNLFCCGNVDIFIPSSPIQTYPIL